MIALSDAVKGNNPDSLTVPTTLGVLEHYSEVSRGVWDPVSDITAHIFRALQREKIS